MYDELLAAAARCICVSFAEMKHSKSVVDAHFGLTMGMSIDDLNEFISNNESLKSIWLENAELSKVTRNSDGLVTLLMGLEPLSLEHNTVLSIAMASAQLETIYIQFCRFENDGSFGRMLEGCKRVTIFVCHVNATHSAVQ